MRVAYLILVLVSLLFCSFGFSFPQMVLHGYTNCAACHVNTSGGGLLTPYGRSAIGEALSVGSPVELPRPSWLEIGGDVRMLQQHVETKAYDRKQFIFMQADLEVGVVTDTLQVVGTVGREPLTEGLFSRRHYAQLHVGNNYLRVGKLFRTYGIRWPDHYLFVRRDLGMDAGTEKYRAEFAHVDEDWEWSLSAGEDGYDGRVGLALGDWIVGASASLGQTKMAGTWSVVRLGDAAIFVELNVAGPLIEHALVEYNLAKGFSLFIEQEYAGFVDSPLNRKTAYGAGARAFPIPHLVLTGALRRTTTSDSAFLLLHVYL